MIAALLLLTGLDAAAPPPPVQPRVAAKGSFFAISVADLDTTEKWYTEKLGLRRKLAPAPNGGQAMRLLEGPGIVIELIKNPDARSLKALTPPIERDYLVHGIFKAGIMVDDFDGVLKSLRERGVTIAFGPFPATQEQRANAVIRDNEGNFLQIVGDYPATGQSGN